MKGYNFLSLYILGYILPMIGPLEVQLFRMLLILLQANRDVTRMDIFLSLVGLLQQTTSSSSSESQPNKVADSNVPVITDYQQSPMPFPISLADGIQ